ncbi:CBS domain-containing protein [Syntrophobacter fumaroxidans]|uniref:Putative signal-transduction protein with CBS domains n=1 Tax=Syntrophobacter fumaroxidans (strain DSM 10017 / MPOB) TaxID=335543 RepID=A0LLQ5_SYNFM|nr:CBS domain-containing protein [Syntrophobacter fumaroxidans]ABK18357.1 putative signal-transduction protein with CBS domains [Syntrophobacter fumaroxidans MPOB]
MEGTTRVCDLMHKGVVFCRPEDNLKEVAGIMKENGLRSVVVMHESGEVWGLISLLEIIRSFGEDLEGISAESVMQPYKIHVDPQWPIERSIELMKKRRIEHLIIVDPHAGPKRPIGLLSSYDIVRYMAHIPSGQFEHVLRLHTANP